ncbi:MAG: iron ABC transporter permease [Gemmatimonadota bacterium]|uniref:FecCD family ABC transporter permease n=1 Tax=Candidatus Palauibacter scopulicola TaxID=3056741 RepID=UPI0023993355|nr:iron ABC transporter permease [Candidatus Palauibacter scopulicola]MDE2663780.1 iron ABC transporter permease [Candidatus Palauibacter scopulicola]
MLWLLLGAALLILVGLELTLGAVWIPPGEVLGLLAGTESDAVLGRILLEFRVPRMLTAIVAGASLGVCGMLLQTTFRNPLADAWFLGLVHSARLGVAVLVVTSAAAGQTVLASLGVLSNLSLVVAAATGALVMTLILMALAPRVGPVTLLLSGLMLGQTAEGLISVVLHFTTEAQARAFASWNDGTFTTVSWSQWSIMGALTLVGLVAALGRTKSLNSLMLGDDYARTLGLRVKRARIQALAAAALLAGVVTAFCGPIAFLGLLAPHLARALFGTADHRALVPAAAVTGAALAALADLITHLPWSRHVLHMNAVMGLIGAPVVLVLLLRRAGVRRFEN